MQKSDEAARSVQKSDEGTRSVQKTRKQILFCTEQENEVN